MITGGISTVLWLLALASCPIMLWPNRSRVRLVHLGSAGTTVINRTAARGRQRILAAVDRVVTGRRSAGADSLQLAVTWDLLAAGLRSGMPVPAAVRAAADTAPEGVRTVLLGTAERLALGTDPVDAWRGAAACHDTAELSRVACRTARSGAALAVAAAELAESVRASAGDRARARSQRAGVLLTGPLGLCFLPAFLCLGVIPVVIGLASQLSLFE